ncbi:MAG TPA: helix-turn-helix transcriptional regulator [Candidatus Acidoferrales bacterium]|nr:helix-turn-helix transcriptional regulator [Candidatus Acidoferrales bacterium]
MKLGDKIRSLRYAEGILRGLGREMTQGEVVRATRKELGKSISQAYFSQIESGSRPHLTRDTRELLARFFKVHPGFLVDDPDGFYNMLISSLPVPQGKLDLWLFEGARRFRRDGELSAVLEKLGHREDARRCLILLDAILDAPGLAPRLLQVLRPGSEGSSRYTPPRMSAAQTERKSPNRRAGNGKGRQRS